MSALFPSAHFPNVFFFNYFLLVFIGMVEVSQNVSDISKSLSKTVSNISENFENEKK